jgi:hypothetical protein
MFVPVDAPLRIRHVKTAAETIDHPKVMKMLAICSRLADQHGFAIHGEPRSVQMSNKVGEVVRVVGNYIARIDTRIAVTKAAQACFIIAAKQLGLRVAEAWFDMDLPESVLVAAQKIYGAFLPLKTGR